MCIRQHSVHIMQYFESIKYFFKDKNQHFVYTSQFLCPEITILCKQNGILFAFCAHKGLFCGHKLASYLDFMHSFVLRGHKLEIFFRILCTRQHFASINYYFLLTDLDFICILSTQHSILCAQVSILCTQASTLWKQSSILFASRSQQFAFCAQKLVFCGHILLFLATIRILFAFFCTQASIPLT